ncbi:MAG TPA: 2-hydroxyacyl-CoA dehydratase family protein [Negativicutes bacterium]
MNRIQEILATLQEIARHPAKSVKAAMKKTGKKAVGCFPYYTPEEIIYAAGMLPVGLWGGQSEIKMADRYLQSFCCSIMRENIEFGMKGTYDFLAAVIIPIYCDTLKCICENWKVAVPHSYLIPVVYPQNRKLAVGTEYLVGEYKQVQSELEKISGKLITENDLESSIALYEEYRKTMRQFVTLVNSYPQTINAKTRHLVIKAAYFTDKKYYTGLIKELIAELQKLPAEQFDGLKVVITGILAEPEALLDVFVQNNIAFVADDLAQESRQFRNCIRNEGSALEKLAFRIADQEGCSLLFDAQKTRGQMLIDLVKQHKADGIVIFMLKFCEPEEFDYPVYKKEIEAANIPILYLEIEQKMDSIEQIRTRIQSFTEMIN